MSELALPSLAALAAAATWALGSHLFHRSLRAGARAPSPAAANLFKNLLAFVLFALAFPLIGARWPPADAWPALLASGFFGFALGDTLYFAALPRAGVQAAAMMGQVHVPTAVLLAWIVRGERLSGWTLAASVLVIMGVMLVVLERPLARPEDRAARRFGIWCALLAAVSQAIGVVIGHGGMSGVDLLGGTLARMIGGIAGAFVVAIVCGLWPRVKGRSSKVRTEVATLVAPLSPRSPRNGLVIAALFGSVIGLPLYHIALRALPSGVSAVLFATTPLFTLPIGSMFGERHELRAHIGTWLGFAGVACVVWSLHA